MAAGNCTLTCLPWNRWLHSNFSSDSVLCPCSVPGFFDFVPPYCSCTAKLSSGGLGLVVVFFVANFLIVLVAGVKLVRLWQMRAALLANYARASEIALLARSESLLSMQIPLSNKDDDDDDDDDDEKKTKSTADVWQAEQLAYRSKVNNALAQPVTVALLSVFSATMFLVVAGLGVSSGARFDQGPAVASSLLALAGTQLGLAALTLYTGWFALYCVSLTRNEPIPDWRRNGFLIAHWSITAFVFVLTIGLTVWSFVGPPTVAKVRLIARIEMITMAVLQATIIPKLLVPVLRLARRFFCDPLLRTSLFSRAVLWLWANHLVLGLMQIAAMVLSIDLAVRFDVRLFSVFAYVSVINELAFCLVAMSTIADRRDTEERRATIYFPLALLSCCAAELPTSAELDFNSDHDDHSHEKKPLVDAQDRQSVVQSYVTTADW